MHSTCIQIYYITIVLFGAGGGGVGLIFLNTNLFHVLYTQQVFI